MALQTKTIHGARAKLFIDGKAQGQFNSVRLGVSYSHIEPYILGRFSAAEIALTGMDPVRVSLSGYRKYTDGPYANIGMSKLQDLLNEKEVAIVIEDRGDQDPNKPIAVVVACKCVGFDFDVSSREAGRLSVEFVGLRFQDESGDQSEPVGSVEY